MINRVDLKEIKRLVSTPFLDRRKNRLERITSCVIDFWLYVGCLDRETEVKKTIITTYEHDMPVALRLTAHKVKTTNRFQISALSIHFTFRQKATIKSMNQSVFPHLHFLFLCRVSYVLVFATACPHVRERWSCRYPTASPCPICIQFDL